MRCISCDVLINPQWKHAIEQNICPMCGQEVMPVHLKNCIVELKKAMQEMQQYPEQLNDLLLSNYNYIKIDDPNLINYLPKELIKDAAKEIVKEDKPEAKQSIIKIKLPGGGTQDVLVEKTQSEAKTNGFFERAEVLKGSGKTSGKAIKEAGEPDAPKSVSEKTANLKKLAQQIREEAHSGITSEDQMVHMIEGVDADPEAVSDYSSLIDDGGIISSGLQGQYDGEDEEIAPAALAMARMAKQGAGGNSNAKDLQSLQEMHAKAQGAAKRLNSGGGSFSRGG